VHRSVATSGPKAYDLLGETGRTLGMHGWCSEAIRISYAMAENNVLRFSTKRTEDGTGLVLYEFRAYSPALGRWLSRDPILETAFPAYWQMTMMKQG